MAEIMLLVAGILPIGMPLHEPEVICWPSVRVSPEQKLMKFAGSLGGVKLGVEPSFLFFFCSLEWIDLRCGRRLSFFDSFGSGLLAGEGAGCLEGVVV